MIHDIISFIFGIFVGFGGAFTLSKYRSSTASKIESTVSSAEDAASTVVSDVEKKI